MIQVILKAFFAALILSLIAIHNTGCAARYPKWDGKIYSIDTMDAALVRPVSFEKIGCNTPPAKEYRCVSEKDFKSFWLTYVLGCEKWKPEVPMGSGGNELHELYNALQELFNK